MKSLWPDDLGQVGTVRTPTAIIKEQASFLSQQTNNLIEAEVLPVTSFESMQGLKPRRDWGFFLKAPTLGDYRFRLFTMTHRFDALYPVSLIVDVVLAQQIGALTGVPENAQNEGVVMDVSLPTETDLIKTLSRILQAPRTREIVQAIYLQAKALAEDVKPKKSNRPIKQHAT